MGVPGPTLGMPHPTPPGYTVTGMVVIMLDLTVKTVDVVSVEVKPVNVL